MFFMMHFSFSLNFLENYIFNNLIMKMQKYDHACNFENDNENCMSYVNARQKSNDFTPSEINLIYVLEKQECIF